MQESRFQRLGRCRPKLDTSTGFGASARNSVFRPWETCDDDDAPNRARPRGRLGSRRHSGAGYSCMAGRGGGVRLQIRHGVAGRPSDGHSLARSDSEDQGGKRRPARHYVLPEQRARSGHRDDVAGDRRRARNLRHVDWTSWRRRTPPAAIFGVGFAFPDYDMAWKAMDGDLGAYCRGLAEKAGLYCMDKAFDHGFREITMKSKPINTPDDLKGVKIRLPVAPLFICAVPASRRVADPDQFRRGVQRTADRAGRRPGKPADPDRHGQALRGAEILQHDQPHLGRVAHLVQQRARGNGCRPICRRSPTSISAPPRWPSAPTGRSWTRPRSTR